MLENMSKRRRGYPSETKVKVGVRVVHGGKLLVTAASCLWKSSVVVTFAHAAATCGSNDVASSRAAFDGVNRDHYF